MNRNDIHVVPRGEQWAVEREGSERASFLTTTQGEALAKARELSILSGGGEVSIHGRDGRIRDKRTYVKKDPYPPLG